MVPSLVVLAVKLWDPEETARQPASPDAGKPQVLSLHNGVHKDTVLRRHPPDDTVLGGARLLARHPSQAPVVSELLTACHETGIDAETSEETDKVSREKFVPCARAAARPTSPSSNASEGTRAVPGPVPRCHRLNPLDGHGLRETVPAACGATTPSAGFTDGVAPHP
ncbi:hypothetical protein ACFVH9_20850 [Streptomyces hirsutus]|uniref:hypothetical protein n=1 Tax=Streptomyces hirsutus TaxID=35620 RepID=UPI003629712D